MYDRATRIFEGGGIFPQILFSVDQLNISFALAESGMGLCFVTDTLVKYGSVGQGVKLYKVTEASAGRTLYVAYKRSRYCTSAMKRFIEIAREIVDKNKN